ncbi:alpha/beta hydrolase [Nocardia sp. NPDC005978]|uniref:alpha/beta fold hydrolase n=1 Tax=Nocardia sp. NPDC005978 TaxID=3156725 RepID=UPI0033BF37A8
MTDSVPVVFVHGIRLSGAAWTTVAERVGRDRAVRAVDLPGHGARRGGVFTLPGAAAAVLDAVDEVGGRALVVGHSLGGYVGIAAAAKDPGRVAGLVVAGSTTVPSPAATAPFSVMHRVLTSRRDGGKRASERLFGAVLPAPVATAISAGGIATEVIPDVVRALRGFDVLHDLAAYPGPVWLINGGHDHLRWHERRFAAANPDARLIVVPGGGHYLPMARPVEFARLVRDAAAAVPGVRV